ncbi:hypothetical protein HU200_019870 [Digitaria exilis]|uniref:Rx N-terminal domain-containing protein n=1 Tax=Digitaria exilis TaxID=1010633 RepID=A0A835F264_9POAL|nr:hypothetical protein HU200_019870 [Digitaria exilis]
MAAGAAIMFAGKLAGTAAEGLEDVRGRVLKSMKKVQVVFDIVDPEYIKKQSSALDVWLWQFRDAVEERRM